MVNLINTFSGKLSFGDSNHLNFNNGAFIDAASNGNGDFIIRNASEKLSNEAARIKIAREINTKNHKSEALKIALEGNDITNAYFETQHDDILLYADINGSIHGVTHPLSAVLPSINGTHEFAYAMPCNHANLYYLHPDLNGPLLFEKINDENIFYGREKSLFNYLGRIISPQSPGKTDGLSKRFVEPGVGRSFLIDMLTLKTEPHYKDFSATGIGLTPYSQNGFVFIGRTPDGKVALIRANHRKNIAEHLNSIGCRAGKVIAIIELPDETVQMMDGTLSPRAIVVRAFKNVLRVKQIDPIAGFYHSLQHSAKISSMMLEDFAAHMNINLSQPTYDNIIKLCSNAVQFENYSASSNDFYSIINNNLTQDNGIRSYRRSLIKKYGYTILNLSKSRVESEIKCDLTMPAYIEWFAATLGRQLASMREAKFLHDYHHPGVGRYHQNWVYTLIEHNVTLSAEFADLETSVFLNDTTEEIMFDLQITKQDVALLRKNFSAYHLMDYNKAKRVVTALAMAAACCDLIVANQVQAMASVFDNNYKRK